MRGFVFATKHKNNSNFTTNRRPISLFDRALKITFVRKELEVTG